jgi:hypothetical protein
MGLGPPSCDDCHVWLILYLGEMWVCPVCGNEPNHGYTHLQTGVPPLDESNIPLLRFMRGKSPNQ